LETELENNYASLFSFDAALASPCGAIALKPQQLHFTIIGIYLDTTKPCYF
jgi:hypothetical protein